jgi:predicted type IV restriction endonuclease
MPAPQIILDLIERFERNLDAYKAGSYNETQVRHEFIDPFFEALGWDVNNQAGNAEAYKDVIHEDAVKVSGVTKAPDYSFRIGGQRKFFVEAKKPSVNIKDAPAAAFQVRRYAWSAKLPLSIVTDFKELAVYDCRFKPDQNDKADNARIKYYTYRQYAEKWDEIAAIFSKDSILKGSFDKYAESNKAKRGTAEVDSAFLAEIESWREMLAKNIALRNTLSVRELNDSVQRIIDRIIFLRIAEDRGIEDYGSLRGICNGNNTYGRLQELFYKADDRYNSGLFHFREEKDETEPPDNLTTTLTIDDKPLKDILKTLYYPDSPYEFAVLPADILGQVYEQFLGKVIRLTSDHRAVVEDKPEVKKAGGVFYTPTYIVEYIVKNTVGKLLDGKTPKKAESLRILDPACGSGSFLLGAYQYLLEWHLKYYTANNPEKHAREKRPVLYSGQGGAWHLTTAERKRILLNNIYGVDIDSQAVEVTKLSLLLKVLEDETGETLNQQRKLFHERALPNLGGNIKCGNSLIGPDFYDGKQMNLMDTEEAQRVNVFDWQAEFPEIFKAGGFDVVIGNPPYGADLSSDQKAYSQKYFKGESKSLDTYELFLLQAKRLLQFDGRISMIIPASWFTGAKYESSRRKLVNELYPVVAYALPFDIFKNAYIDTAIIVLTSAEYENCLVHFFPKKERLTFVSDNLGTKVPIVNIRQDSQCRLSMILSKETAPLLNKVNLPKIQFGDWFEISRGVQPYSRSKHTEQQIQSRFLHATLRKSKQYLPELQGNELSRYCIAAERTSFLKYSDEIASIRSMRMFEGKRIALRRLLTRKFRLQAGLAIETMITTDNVLNMIPKIKGISIEFAIGILNSKLISWVYVNTSMIAQKDDFPQVHISALSAIHLPECDKTKQDQMVQLVEQMLSLHKQLPEAKTGHEQTLIQRQIDATDQQIDKLVYELYELTPEEIAIVEKQ